MEFSFLLNSKYPLIIYVPLGHHYQTHPFVMYSKFAHSQIWTADLTYAKTRLRHTRL